MALRQVAAQFFRNLMIEQNAYPSSTGAASPPSDERLADAWERRPRRFTLAAE